MLLLAWPHGRSLLPPNLPRLRHEWIGSTCAAPPLLPLFLPSSPAAPCITLIAKATASFRPTSHRSWRPPCLPQSMQRFPLWTDAVLTLVVTCGNRPPAQLWRSDWVRSVVAAPLPAGSPLGSWAACWALQPVACHARRPQSPAASPLDLPLFVVCRCGTNMTACACTGCRTLAAPASRRTCYSGEAARSCSTLL